VIKVFKNIFKIRWQIKTVCTKMQDSVATSRLAVRWMRDTPRTGCALRIALIWRWPEQAILKWSLSPLLLAATVWNFALCRSGVPIATVWKRYIHQARYACCVNTFKCKNVQWNVVKITAAVVFRSALLIDLMFNHVGGDRKNTNQWN